MNATNNKELAREHVQAFMDLMKEQHDIDDEKFARMIKVAQKNGRVYVTWAWILSILLGVVGFLVVRQLDAIEKRMDVFEARQADVRERLKSNETLLREHMARNGSRPQ